MTDLPEVLSLEFTLQRVLVPLEGRIPNVHTDAHMKANADAFTRMGRF
jgi:hypothetical protein